MRVHMLGAVLVAMSTLSGCAAMEQATLREEARQLAWNGPGPGPCAFGGVTKRAVAHCARVNFGEAATLEAINNTLADAMPAGATCEQHVAAAERAVAQNAGYDYEPVYSCPDAARAAGECHVSLLVTTPHGDRYVMDNGAVLGEGNHVATLEQYSARLHGIYWRSLPPTRTEVVAAYADFPSASKMR